MLSLRVLNWALILYRHLVFISRQNSLSNSIIIIHFTHTSAKLTVTWDVLSFLSSTLEWVTCHIQDTNKRNPMCRYYAVCCWWNLRYSLGICLDSIEYPGGLQQWDPRHFIQHFFPFYRLLISLWSKMFVLTEFPLTPVPLSLMHPDSSALIQSLFSSG